MSDRIDELVECVVDAIGADPPLEILSECALDAITELATIARGKVHCGGVIESTSGECLTLMEAQNAAFDAEERALKAEAMCERLAERLGAKAWMSLTGITRKALGGDDEPTRDAFVAAEAKSQLAAAREAVAALLAESGQQPHDGTTTHDREETP